MDKWRKTREGQKVMLHCWLLCVEAACYHGEISVRGRIWFSLLPYSVLRPRFQKAVDAPVQNSAPTAPIAVL